VRRRVRAQRSKELKVAGWALFNLFLGIAVQGVLETALVQTLGKRDIKESTSRPCSQEIPKNLLLVPTSPGSNPYISQRWALFNLFLGIAVQGVLETALVQTLGKRSALKVSQGKHVTAM
jgi:hypothetical protein